MQQETKYVVFVAVESSSVPVFDSDRNFFRRMRCSTNIQALEHDMRVINTRRLNRGKGVRLEMAFALEVRPNKLAKRMRSFERHMRNECSEYTYLWKDGTVEVETIEDDANIVVRTTKTKFKRGRTIE